MNSSATKLAVKLGVGTDVAEALVKAGYTNPRKLRDAKEDDLLKVKGVTKSVTAAIARKKAKA